ncbi:ABC transporter substrate binding protein (PQQ-dependent alcohol dehydrogenase system) [Cereibacter ovatus]|uniref:ABC transporter substrate binding protein (PQQ-dependent alcohol dehydrogenase system) n=1 Tax=Cereibacter ovatus TaxID=439529 RepID=A0A285CJ46_9RHOB|nr:ABC transporter substrate-binding protein [Cereibacter ovatus]SNX67550.1 ABC transporter substrate binding protein (PQQ-dependent alcohol dehydrogenase system) [Cereibacter ovatus]
MRHLKAAVLAALVWPATVAAQTEIRAAVLRVDVQGRPPVSRLDLPPDDLGLAGARLGTADNATTGRFMGQTFITEEVTATPETAVQAIEALVARGTRMVVTLADEATTLALADAAGEGVLLFNARARGDELRNDQCRANLLHVAPSRAMVADGLAQFLMWKRWDEWFLISGSHPADRALADALRRAATKFGARIVEERTFEDTGGARATDSGLVQIQAQIPAFTQRAADHDVVVAADETGLFAAYLPFHTWEPRPVAGSAGLRPVTWHPAMEMWGGTQFQTRFEKQSARPAREEDYQVWLALRAIGEAATRTGSGDMAVLRDYMLGDQFQLGAFKGQALTFRDWDGQLRQPILLGSGPIVASVSPQSEYLHQVSQLDTLGTDRPESGCRIDRKE